MPKQAAQDATEFSWGLQGHDQSDAASEPRSKRQRSDSAAQYKQLHWSKKNESNTELHALEKDVMWAGPIDIFQGESYRCTDVHA